MRKRSIFPALLFLSLLFPFFFQGCDKGAPAGEPINPNVTLPEAGITADGYISLSKEALEKEFLLQAFFIDQRFPTVFGTALGTQSRIIYFERQKDSLFMMESAKGLLPSDELPSERILAEFKVISEKENELVFDFNEGMKKIFIVADWYASGPNGRLPQQRTAPISHSLLKEVTREKGRILIRQLSQVEAQGWLGNYALPVEIVYYLEPYQPDPSFQSVPNPGFERMGFIVANPQVQSELGSLQHYVTKWNLNKPVVFHISDNTPEEYREAIKEGVLYWNKVFGAEVVQVEMAPKGVRAPHPDYNMIQWVTYHYAGYAYADAQVDPRTGEIRHAQIYLTTAHVVPTMGILHRAEKVDDFSSLGLKGFSSGMLCHDAITQDLSNLIALETPDKKIPLQLTQDFLRNTAAHEVGHTLGLTHNFAGSASSSLRPREIVENFEAYLKEGEWKKPRRVASTVMDYLRIEERVLNGAYIGKKENEPLPYDAMAIQWAYFGVESKKDLSEVLFCTHSHLGWFESRYADCDVWDRSSHPLLGAASDFEKSVKDLPKRIAKIYLMTKTYFDPEKRRSVESVPLDAGDFAQQTTQPLSRFLEYLKGNVRSLAVERTFPAITDLNEKEVYNAHTRWLDKAVSQGGGVPNLLSLIHSHQIYDAILHYPDAFKAIVDNPDFREGKTPSGEAYKFSNTEIFKMKKQAGTLFAMLEEKLLRDVTEKLAGTTPQWGIVQAREASSIPPLKFRSISGIAGLEETLGNWAEFVIAEGAEKEPKFDGDHRLLATRILQFNQGPTEDWQKENRRRVLNLLMAKLEQRYQTPMEHVDPKSLPEEERKAFEVEISILVALGYHGMDPNEPLP